MINDGDIGIAYEKGWNHAKPYWEDKYQDRVREALNTNPEIRDALTIYQIMLVTSIINGIEPEDIK
jgi:hypothetical protein